VTGVGGYWEWLSPEYWFTSSNPPQEVNLQVCEVLPPNSDWHQSYPTPSCYTLKFTPVVPGFDSFYDLDFGNWYPGEKSGLKFEDLDADGAPQENKEPGLAGWTIYVDYNGNSILDPDEPSAVTDADGKYKINGVKPGEWTVREVLKTGWTCSYPNPCNYVEKFYSRAVFTDNDFGNWYPATKGGYKWYDRDGNGKWDDGEPVIPGWKIEVYDSLDMLVASTLTNNSGYYEFSLKPGFYTVKELCPNCTDWYQTWPAPTDGCGSGVYGVTLTSRQVEKDNNFGNYCKGYADFGTKGYWHNKNGLSELYNDPDFPALIAYINSLDPYNDPSGYFDNGGEPFDGHDEFGNPVPPAIDSLTDFGLVYNEISQFLVDPNAGGDPREQLAQQLLAFIFNANYRLDDPAASIWYGGMWYSAQGLIDQAVGIWGDGTAAEQTAMQEMLNDLNESNYLPFIHYDPCKVVYP
jgi:hypothetical protein